ncbi:MAG: hypothetical protein RMJ33_10925 [Saprospiraceae bacterium]|nr:hypothetical protein [Saprospiraceae bacterium]
MKEIEELSHFLKGFEEGAQQPFMHNVVGRDENLLGQINALVSGLGANPGNSDAAQMGIAEIKHVWNLKMKNEKLKVMALKTEFLS